MANSFKDLQDSILYQIGDQGAPTRVKIKRWLNDARNTVWEQVEGLFKESSDYLITSAAYSSTSAITVAVTNGSTTVTSDGATNTAFTAAMEGRFIQLNGTDPWYKIASRDSATQLTLADAYVGSTDTACAFTVNTYIYDLPSDFQRLILCSLELEANWMELPILDRVDVYASLPVPLRWDVGTPEICWVEEEVSSRYQLGIFPPPESASLVRFRYYTNPTEMRKDSDTTGIPNGDAAIKAAALAEAYNWRGKINEAAFWYARYEKELEILRGTTSRTARKVFRARDHTDACRPKGITVNRGAWYQR